MSKIGFGGSCHWCTEAIFQSLKGVTVVHQGWISSEGSATSFSEAVIVEFNDTLISLETLIAVHLHTHSCTADHSMRSKYRSAVYTIDAEQALASQKAITELQPEFDRPIITEVLPLLQFKINKEAYLNYYYSNPKRPFCENIVNPKLKLLLNRFGNLIENGKLDLT